MALIYGSNYSIAKLVMPNYIAPAGFVALRVITGAVLFFIIYRFFLYEKIKSIRHHIQLAVASVFGVAANMICFFEGLSRTNPINASVLMLFTPIFVVLFVSVVGKKKLKLHRYIGILLACLGAAFLIDAKNFNFSSENSLGDFLIIINALCYGYYLYYVTKLVHIYKPVTIMCHIFLYGAILVIPYGISAVTDIQWHTFDATIWWSVVFVLLMVTVMSYLLNAFAIQHASSTVVGAYIYLQPLFATIISIFLGTDSLNFIMVFAALLIFSGVYLASTEFLFGNGKHTENQQITE